MVVSGSLDSQLLKYNSLLLNSKPLQDVCIYMQSLVNKKIVHSVHVIASTTSGYRKRRKKKKLDFMIITHSLGQKGDVPHTVCNVVRGSKIYSYKFE